MARFKDFGNPADSMEKQESLTFKIYDEEFVCHPALPGKVLLQFVQQSDSEKVSDSAGAIMDFFKHVLTVESYERFDALASDPDKIITMTTLSEIIAWVMEEYSDRPTKGSEPSPTGE